MKKNNFITLICGVVFLFLLFPEVVFAQANSLKLSPSAEVALNKLAKGILTQGYNPKITDIKSQLDPTDYATVKTIKILPTNPLFVFKYSINEIIIFFTFDTKTKAHLMLINGNEKTLESLLTIEKAVKENNPILKNLYVSISAALLGSVGRDFDYVSQNINSVDKDEAFKFAGIYFKHQILLQQEEDKLSESEFIKIETIRVRHLGSLAHIIVSGNAKNLTDIISSQVGLNYKDLAAAAILRDLENNAAESDRTILQAAQDSLLKDFQLKLSNLSNKDRSAEIARYAAFIHGNPIRQFQAYDQIPEFFNLRDAAAKNFQKHLEGLNNSQLQSQFVQTLFSEFPIDLRIVFYTEIQSNTDNLKQVKTILGSQICRNFDANPGKLATTRFYSQSIRNPDVLDLKIGQFLVDSIQNCNSKSDTTLKLVTDLQKAINNNFAKEAKLLALPESKLIEKETKQIEYEATTPKTIIGDVVTLEEPTKEEITQKEQEIIEEIIDAAETGEKSPLVEELPAPVQEEIAQEVKMIASPAPSATLIPTQAATPVPTAVPTFAPTSAPLPTEEPTLMETVESMAPSPTPMEVTTPSL